MPAYFPPTVGLVLSRFELDLDEGSLVLSAAGVGATDPTGLDCTRFTIVSER